MKTQALYIEIVPYRSFRGTADTELRIKIVSYPGEEVHLSKIVAEDDLISFFDQVWEKAGRQIKEALLKQEQSML